MITSGLADAGYKYLVIDGECLPLDVRLPLIWLGMCFTQMLVMQMHGQIDYGERMVALRPMTRSSHLA